MPPVKFLDWSSGHWATIALVSCAVSLIPVAIHGAGFYFADDVEAQFLPMFHEIGRQLCNFRFPLVTLSSWTGGNILGEYQYGIFNPITDLLCVVLYGSDLSYAVQADIFAVFHLITLACGVAACCAALRCRLGEALYASVITCSSIWIIYWAASDWLPILVSLSWCSWAFAAILRVRSDVRWLIPTGLLIALTVASGFPQTDIALAIFAGASLLCSPQATTSRAAMLVVIASGFLLASPAVIPFLDAALHSERTEILREMGAHGWVVSFHALLGLGLPVYPVVWTDWADHAVTTVLPMTYLDWAFPLILGSAMRERRCLQQDTNLRMICLVALALLALTLLPLGSVLRFPFRFLPMANLAASLAVARYIAARRETGTSSADWDWLLFFYVVGVPTIVALFNSAQSTILKPIIFATCLVIGIFTAAIIYLPKNQAGRWTYLLSLFHIIIFCALIAAWPANPHLSRWFLPESPKQETEPVYTEDGNTLFLFSWPIDAYLDRSRWLHFGNGSLFLERHTVNGYTATGPAPVLQFFDFGFIGQSQSDRLQKLFEMNNATGVSYADLFQLDTIVAEIGTWADRAKQEGPATWSRFSTPDGLGLILRRPPTAATRQGSLSFLPKGVNATLVSFADRREVWHLDAAQNYDGRPVIFARPWYTGYHLYLNGREVEPSLQGGILPGVNLPPGFQGSLEIVFMPTSLKISFWIAGLSATLLFATASWGKAKRSPRSLPTSA